MIVAFVILVASVLYLSTFFDVGAMWSNVALGLAVGLAVSRVPRVMRRVRA